MEAHDTVGSARKLSPLEPLIFVALALFYVWVLQPTRQDLLRVPFLVVVVLLPFASNLLHRDRRTDLGLRLDNLRESALEVGLATAIGIVVVMIIGAFAGGPSRWPGMAAAFFTYPAWALAQQYAMQAFTFRRLRDRLDPGAAALATGVLFGLVHWPNLALASVTAVGGYIWCRLFERHPNLITLALSHGWLAVILRSAWPAEWLHNLRIGPGYWTWTP